MEVVVRKREAGVIDWRLKKQRINPQLYYRIDRKKELLIFPWLLADEASGDYVSAHNFDEYFVKPKGRLAQLVEVGVVLESIYRVANSASAKLKEPIDCRGVYIEFFDPRVDLAGHKRIYDYAFKI